MIVDQERSPIIIYGAPRSGTTYLTCILNEHPEVFVSIETRVFAWAHYSLNVLTHNDQFLSQQREQFVQYLHTVYPRLIRDFYRMLRPQACYWGDKNPLYAEPTNRGCLEAILALFPGAHFIHIIRDGRDVVSSVIRRRWRKFEGAHQWWKDHVDIGSAFGRSIPPDQYFELRYEDLVRDDGAVACKLFDFLGIEVHPRVLKFCQAQQEQRTPINLPTRDLSSNEANVDWRTLLAPDQQLHSLELLGGHLIKYGYETASSLAEVQRELSELCQSAPH